MVLLDDNPLKYMFFLILWISGIFSGFCSGDLFYNYEQQKNPRRAIFILMIVLSILTLTSIALWFIWKENAIVVLRKNTNYASSVFGTGYLLGEAGFMYHQNYVPIVLRWKKKEAVNFFIALFIMFQGMGWLGVAILRIITIFIPLLFLLFG